MKHSLAILTLATSLLLPGIADASSEVQTITVALQGADIAVVAESFARMAESELEIDPAIVGKVDLNVQNVTWMTALDAVCEGIGCRWQLVGGPSRLLRLEPAEAIESPVALDTPISMDLEGAAIADVLTSFGRIADHDVEIAPDLQGKVTLGIQNVSVRTALRAVCESVGCTWEEAQGTLRFRAASTDPN